MINFHLLKKLAAALACAMFAVPHARAADEPIMLGLHGAMTGPASWIGLGGRDGTAMAIAEINAAGGINGRQLKMVTYDDAGKPSEADAMSRKMIESDKVFAIIGGSTSSPTISAASAAHEAKVPYMNGVAASPKILDIQSRWVFNGASIDVRDIAENEAIFIGTYLKPKKVAALCGTDEFSLTLSTEVQKHLKERYGIETTTVQKFNGGDTDFTSQLLAIKQSNPDYIVMAAYYVEAARIIRQARELGIKIPIEGTPSMMNSGLLTVAGSAAEGLMTSYIPLYYNGDPNKEMVEFEARYRKMFPNYPVDRPNFVDMYSYGSMYALAEGMRRAGKDMTRKSLVESLETLKDFKATDSFPKATNVVQPISYVEGHAGNRRMTYFKVSNGAFRVLPDYKSGVPPTRFPPNAALKW